MNLWQTQIESGSVQSVNHTLMEREVFSARRRPLYPRLTILDDGANDGEMIRLRSSVTSIGRMECDLNFPAEGLMSRCHAQISYTEVEQGHWEWVIEDKSSRHGTFVRLPEFPLLSGLEFIIGGTKAIVHDEEKVIHGPRGFPHNVIPYLEPSAAPVKQAFLELQPYVFAQSPQRILMNKKTISLGSASEGSKAFSMDPFVEPVHATMYCSSRAGWKLIDQGSLNGVWLRIKRMSLVKNADFLIGEQRFRLSL